METLFGLYAAGRGSVQFGGRTLHADSPVAAVRAGLALCPEDRQSQGLFFNLGVRDNLLVSRELRPGRWRIQGAEEQRAGAQTVDELADQDARSRRPRPIA